MVILWDASGLAKRYTQESGSATVNAIFSASTAPNMFLTAWGYAETYSILLRKYNGGILNLRAFQTATNALRTEIMGMPGMDILSISDTVVFGSLSLMQAHNINSADAAILATYLKFQRRSEERCFLLASDKRLLRSAEAEGLPNLNPEEIGAGDTLRMLSKL